MAAAIIIVSYRNPEDVGDCLRALDRLQGDEAFAVFIVENGGPTAYWQMLKAVSAACEGVADEPEFTSQNPQRALRHARWRKFRLARSGASVCCAQAIDNLGYSGGVNSWLERLIDDARWDGFWILNPDTAPEPSALKALVVACADAGGGMAGSVILDYGRRDRIASRGLYWRRWRAAALSVDQGRVLSTPIVAPLRDIDAPSGTSFFMTRDCLQVIGFMNETYFLYFEDLEYGMRAKAAGLLRRADESLVAHKYGSVLGSARRRASRSRLSVYLDARNTLLFTRLNDNRFMPWAIACSVLKVFEFWAVGAFGNGAAALSGLMAGVRGETGKPQWYA